MQYKIGPNYIYDYKEKYTSNLHANDIKENQTHLSRSNNSEMRVCGIHRF